MTTDQHLEMHQHHRKAETELCSWLDDIYMWRAEHKQALAWLAQLETVIHEKDLRLQQHSTLVDRQERHIRQHEHEIALQEQRNDFKDETALTTQHEDFTKLQEWVEEDHARIGDHHRKLMADLKRLLDKYGTR